MNWIDSIKEIKKAQENDRLVIFVGAGVSANSGLPDWPTLIADIADKINYKGQCDTCEHSCNASNKSTKRKFTSDEYLKIPELFFQSDSSEKHKDYYDYIKKSLSCGATPNAIDKEILNALPRHIITTNYDNLLETADVINKPLYSVVCKDSDLLSKAKARYIVKMHGDLNEEKTIVLKESDYIEYEQNHILISTFIKSLLINHTFLFVGYSLNDYNLKLIIGWINHLARVNKISDRHQNFLVQVESVSESDINYNKSRNIQVVDLTTMPKELIESTNSDTGIDKEEGKMIFAYLKCINNSGILQRFIPLSETLSENYLPLKSYRKISYTDFLKTSEFKKARIEYNNVLSFFDSQEYNTICELLSSPDNESIIDIFARAQIYKVECIDQEKYKSHILSERFKEDNLFQLYLNNQYQEIVDLLPTQHADTQIYYHKLFEKNGVDIGKLVELDESSLENQDLVIIFCKKVRARLALITLFDKQEERRKELVHLYETTPHSVRYSISYMMDNFVTYNDDLLKQMSDLLEKQEEKYSKGNGTIYFENSFAKINQLQLIAYNYYYFFKMNLLPIDNFKDPKSLFSYYLRAILCSYSHPPVTRVDSFLHIENDYSHYPLNDIDIDIMVKFTDANALKSWFSKYSVQQLEFEGNPNLEIKFDNLCKSGSVYNTTYWSQKVLCFAILLCHCKITSIDADRVFESLIYAINSSPDNHVEISSNILDATDIIVQAFNTASSSSKERLLKTIVYSISNSPEILSYYFGKVNNIIGKLSNNITPSVQKSLDQLVDSFENNTFKHNLIFVLRKVLPKDKYGKYITDNLNDFDEEQIFYFIIEKIIPYSSDVQERFLSTISREVEMQKKIPGLTVSPRNGLNAINNLLLLILLGYSIDLSPLSQFKGYSDFLDFALDPENFDYSKVDTANYMWENFIYSTKYKPYFIKHRKEILTDSLENVFWCDAALPGQQKIVYGILLSDDELREYGK